MTLTTIFMSVCFIGFFPIAVLYTRIINIFISESLIEHAVNLFFLILIQLRKSANRKIGRFCEKLGKIKVETQKVNAVSAKK
jgi:multisubunit Na+/H+ antiporter MnhC subunit